MSQPQYQGPPQGWQGQQPGQPGGYGPPPKKGMGGCLKAFLIIGGIGVVVVVGIIAFVVFAVGSSENDAREAAAATCEGVPAYPDQQERDVCADGSGKVAFDGLDVTATQLALADDGFGGQNLCSTVTIMNTSDESKDYNVFDWKIQPPSGAVDTTSAQALGSTLASGTLIAGAQIAGTICSDDITETGVFVVIYKPNPFIDDRGVWQFTV